MPNSKLSINYFINPVYWLTWLGLGMLRISAWLPYPLQMWLGCRLGDLIYRLMPKRRHIVETNIRLCFPERTPQQQQQLVRQTLASAGSTIFEVAISWWCSDRKLMRMHKLEGFENLTNALTQNKGVILLASHFSTMELAGTLAGKHIHNLQVVYKRAHNRLFEWFMQKKRKTNCAGLIQHKDLRGIIRCIRKGDVVWYAPDQDFGEKDSVFAPFMGVPACTLLSTQRIAKLTGAPVVPFFAERNKNNQGYTLHFAKALEDFPCGDDIADATKVNAAIEQQVRQAPEQYLWIHRRFKSRPGGKENIYK